MWLALAITAVIAAIMIFAGVLELASEPCEKCGRPMLHFRSDTLRCKQCELPETQP